MKRTCPDPVALAIILSSALGFTVAPPVWSQGITFYDEFGVSVESDVTQSARDFTAAFEWVRIDKKYPPDTIVRCGVHTERNGEARRGVPWVLETNIFLFDDQGDPIPQDPINDSGRTDRFGWDSHTISPSDYDRQPGVDYLLVLKLELRGGREVDEVHHQCTLGAPSECIADGTTACMSAGGPGRFQAGIDWTDPFNGAPRRARVVRTGKVGATPSEPGGAFAIFNLFPLQDEIRVVVLDGCSHHGVNSNQKFWVVAGLEQPTIDWTANVTDTENGIGSRYFNVKNSGVTDTDTFSGCP